MLFTELFLSVIAPLLKDFGALEKLLALPSVLCDRAE